MTLNVGQYLAPLDSAQVLTGYAQGVKEGTGVNIAPDGTLTLDPTGSATLGYLVSSTIPAPVYNWSLVPGAANSLLINNGLGSVSWTTDYVPTLPQNQNFPHTGAAIIPAGNIVQRPALTAGAIRYNTTTGALEFSDGSSWITVTDSSGAVQSFFQATPPTADNVGDLWYDSTESVEKVWSGSSWVPTVAIGSTSFPGRLQVGGNIQVDSNGIISVDTATGNTGGVSNLGLTTVTDNTSSFATGSALSANQGRLLQLQIAALLVSSNLTFAGLISGVGAVTYATPAGAAQGFSIGAPLPAATPSNDNYFVIVESSGSFIPPGGVLTTVTQGDWFLSTGSSWQFLNVGYDPSYATDTVPGLVELATNAETQTGTDATRAVTPAGLSSRTATEVTTGIAEIATQAETQAGADNSRIVTPVKLRNATVYKSDYTAKGDILSASGAGTPVVLPIGATGQYLRADSAQTTGLTWDTISGSDIAVSPAINGLTNVQSVLENAIYDVSSPGNTILVTEAGVGIVSIDVVQATETQLGGGEIATQAETNAGTDDSRIVTPLKLQNRIASETLTGIAEIATQVETETGTDNTRIVTPLKLRAVAVYKSDYNAKGDILTASANDAPIILPVGTDGQYLRANSGQPSGLVWDTVSASDIVVGPAINGNTDLQVILEDAVYNITSTGNTVVITSAPTGLFNIEVRQATETQLGGAEIATQAETNAGTDDTRIVTPLKLQNRIASETLSGIAEIATQAETNTGIDDTRIVTPFKLNSRTASETLTGIAEIATQAETNAGTDDARIVTPLKLAGRTATETQTGIAEIATQAETNAGTDDTRIITPLKLSTYITGGGINATNISLSPTINGNTNVQAALTDAIYNLVSPNTSVTIVEAAVGQVTLTVTQATETQLGGGEIATQAETNTGTSDTVLITPLKLRTAITGGAINATNIQLSPSINGNTTVQSALNDAIYNIASANLSVTITETPTGQVNLAVTQATETQIGGAEIATQVETNAGTDDTRIVTPLKLATRTATETLTGIAEIATQVETNAGTDDTRIVTPLKLATRTATETLTGIAEIATQVETNTGTDDTRIVTPLKLRTAAVYKSDFNAKGDILSASANDIPLILPVGTDAQYLVADSTTATGLKWYTLPTTVGVVGGVSNAGITTITDTVTSTSVNSALSANQGKLLQDQITALTVATNLTLAGTINGAGNLLYVTADGATAGFVVGSPLPAPAAGNTDYFVICEQPGTFTPPASPAVTVTQGDWLLSTGTIWQLLDVGFNVPAASTTQAGIVELADNTETQTGTDATRAVTPAGLSSRTATELRTGVAEIATQAETDAGTDDTRIVTPLKLATYVSGGKINATQILLSPTINGNTTVQSALNDAIYNVTSTGLSVTITEAATGQVNLAVAQATETQLGGAEIATQVETNTGTDDLRIVTPLKLRTATVYKSDFNAKGDLLSATANDTPQILPVGVDGQVLKADSTTATGLAWFTIPAVVTPAIRNIDDISGSFNGATTAFPLAIGGVAYTPVPTTNIAVFLGGVAQTPGAGNAYTVAGSTITFTSAPPTGTTFYAFTVS